MLVAHHPFSISRRDRNEASRQASDHAPIKPRADRITLIGPGMFVSDHHRDAGCAADHRAPEVGTEHVRMKHVEAPLSEQSRQPEDAEGIPPPPAVEAPVRDVRGTKCPGGPRIDAPREAEPWFETVLRQMGRKPKGKPLSATGI